MSDKHKRLKVLHVIPSVAACRGGPSKAVVEMVSSLRDIGIDAEIATTNDNGQDQLDAPLNDLIDYKGVPTRFFKRFSPPIKAIREFAYSPNFGHWLSNNINEYDVIHVHAIFSYCSSYAMRLARKKGVPYVVRPIGQLQQWSLEQSKSKKALYLNALEKANLVSAAAVHFTSESEQQEALARFRLQTVVVPLGINATDRAPLSKSQMLELWGVPAAEFTILYLSRLHEKKGLELLIQALAKIKTVDFRLLIAGDGASEYQSRLTDLSTQLGIEQRCHFLGHIDGDQKTAALQHSDLYALTSYSENFGISVLEAMASGLAPLISNQVALSKAIERHALGLVSTTDVSDIESKLRFAFTHIKELKLMGRNAQRYTAEHYAWPGIAKQLKELYQTIAKS